MNKLFFILIGALMFSCSSAHKEELNQVEVLQAELATLENTFKSVDYEKALEAKKAYKDNLNKIKSYYFVDTIDHHFTSMLNTYKGVKHSTKTIEFDYNANKTAINTMKSQLKNLHTDIQNDVLPQDSISIFIEQEKINLEKLSDNVGTYVIKVENAIAIHDTLSQKVADFIAPLTHSF